MPDATESQIWTSSEKRRAQDMGRPAIQCQGGCMLPHRVCRRSSRVTIGTSPASNWATARRSRLSGGDARLRGPTSTRIVLGPGPGFRGRECRLAAARIARDREWRKSPPSLAAGRVASDPIHSHTFTLTLADGRCERTHSSSAASSQAPRTKRTISNAPQSAQSRLSTFSWSWRMSRP